MRGRFAATLMLMVLANLAGAQPLEPRFVGQPNAASSDPAAFLLPPVVAGAPRSDSTSPSRASRSDLPRREEPVRQPAVRDEWKRDESRQDELKREETKREEPIRYADTEHRDSVTRSPAARLSRPKDVVPVSAEAFEESRDAKRKPVEPPPSGEELFQYLSSAGKKKKRYDDPDTSALTRSQSSWRFGERIRGLFNFEDRGLFCSDHAFDTLVSPITNPFLFEDPRSLTEVRPIVIYQKIPKEQPNFRGGNLWFFGVQGRVAITERLSITMNKIGASVVDPKGFAPYDSREVGLSELWLGPKYTFIRDEEFGTLLAGGVLFQVPLGGSDVFQNTGKLTITPYVTLAQPFFKTRIGTFNTMANAGYSFSTNNERSDYFHISGHVDYDIGNAHRVFPLLEFNWFQYTKDGTSHFIKGEGRDLINFGSLGKGSSLVTGAVGLKVKPTKNTEVGGAFEIPLIGNNDFMQYRFTLDFIWRY